MADAQKRKQKPTGIECDICNVSFSSVFQLFDHVQGYRHKAKVKSFSPAFLPQLARLQYFIDTYMKLEPLVGLEYVVELPKKKEGSWCSPELKRQYRCLTCSLHGNTRCMLQHLTSSLHIRFYLEKHHASLLADATRDAKLCDEKVLWQVAAKVCENYGKQTIKIKGYEGPQRMVTPYSIRQNAAAADLIRESPAPQCPEGQDGESGFKDNSDNSDCLQKFEIKGNELPQRSVTRYSIRQNAAAAKLTRHFPAPECLQWQDGESGFKDNSVDLDYLQKFDVKGNEGPQETVTTSSDCQTATDPDLTGDFLALQCLGRQDGESEFTNDDCLDYLQNFEIQDNEGPQGTVTTSADYQTATATDLIGDFPAPECLERPDDESGFKDNGDFLDYLQKFEIKNNEDAAIITLIMQNCTEAFRRFLEEQVRESETSEEEPPQTSATETDQGASGVNNSARDNALEIFFDNIRNMEQFEVVAILQKIAATNPAFRNIDIPNVIKYLQTTGRLKAS